MARVGISEDRFIEAIRLAHGMSSHIASRLGITRNAVNKRLRENPKLREAQIEEREKMIDVAETALYRKVEDGNLDAIKYFLSRAGKARGYTTKVEVDANVQSTGRVVLMLPDNGRHGNTGGR